EVVPELGEVPRPGKDRPDPGDGDIEWWPLRRLGCGHCCSRRIDDCTGADTDPRVQLRDRRRRIMKPCGLPDHVEPAIDLRVVVEGQELGCRRRRAEVRISIDALRCNARSADVETLEPVADFF